MSKETCRTCLHKAPGKFTMPPTPGVEHDAKFYGCEYHDKSVGVQDRTPACRMYERDPDVLTVPVVPA